MNTKKFFVISIFLVFLISFVWSASVSDGSSVGTVDSSTVQSFAQVNARITDLANKIESARNQDLNFQDSVLLKSDLQFIYEDIIRINQATEQQIVLDNIMIVVMAFAILFILVGKNLIPQHKKNELKIIDKEKLVEDDILMPESIGEL